MATLRAAQKAMTRKLLLEPRSSLFIEHGYAATTIDLIANSAGTTRVTFYAHFPSRSELMRTLIDENLNAELARTRSSSHGSTAQELVDVVREGNPSGSAAGSPRPPSIGPWSSRSSGRRVRQP